jgi:hypothetical protein
MRDARRFGEAAEFVIFKGNSMIDVAFLASTGQIEAWLKHQKQQREHRTQPS